MTERLYDALWPEPVPVQCPQCRRASGVVGLRYRKGQQHGSHHEGYVIRDPDEAIALIMACACRLELGQYRLVINAAAKTAEVCLVDKPETTP